MKRKKKITVLLFCIILHCPIGILSVDKEGIQISIHIPYFHFRVIVASMQKTYLYSKQWKVALTTSTVISSISFTTFTIPYNSHIIANHSIGIPYLALESQTMVYNILARDWTFGTYSDSTTIWRRLVNLHKQFNIKIKSHPPKHCFTLVYK